jgi:nitrogen fixation-related uncharacterized protein
VNKLFRKILPYMVVIAIAFNVIIFNVRDFFWGKHVE